MKNYILSLMIGLTSCTEIIFVTTSGDSNNSEDSTSSIEITTTSNISESSTSLTTSETGENTVSCMMSRDIDKVCPPGLICVALSFTQEGECRAPCIESCSDNLTCQDWTAMSQPHLPTGVGVCM